MASCNETERVPEPSRETKDRFIVVAWSSDVHSDSHRSNTDADSGLFKEVTTVEFSNRRNKKIKRDG